VWTTRRVGNGGDGPINANLRVNNNIASMAHAVGSALAAAPFAAAAAAATAAAAAAATAAATSPTQHILLRLGRAQPIDVEKLAPAAVVHARVVAVQADAVRLLHARHAHGAARGEVEHGLGVCVQLAAAITTTTTTTIIVFFIVIPTTVISTIIVVTIIAIIIIVIIVIVIVAASAPPIVLHHHAAGRALLRQRALPRLVDVARRKARQLGHVVAYKRNAVPATTTTTTNTATATAAAMPPALRKGDGRVDVREARAEGRAREPLPVARIARGLVVEQPGGEDVGAALPVDVAAAARQEARDGVARQVVQPAVAAQLAHGGVDPREARAAVRPARQPRFGQRLVDGVGARQRR
jgi:hypothetical protein